MAQNSSQTSRTKWLKSKHISAFIIMHSKQCIFTGKVFLCTKMIAAHQTVSGQTTVDRP